MKPKTFALMILDKSGSMNSCREATITAFNEKIQQWKLDAAEQDILVSLYSFNGSVYEHCVNVPASEMVELTLEDYECGGSTGYYKAIGYAVSKLRDETKNETGDYAFLCEIISDGENTDQHPDYSCDMVKALIQELTATGHWTFGYIGASAELAEEAAVMTQIRGNVASGNLSNNRLAAKSYQAASLGTQTFMRTRKSGQAGGQACLRTSNLYSANADEIANLDSVDIGRIPTYTVTSTGPGPSSSGTLIFKIAAESKGLKGKVVI